MDELGSGDLEHLKPGKTIGRYAFAGLKVFVPRDGSLEEEGVARVDEWLRCQRGFQRVEVTQGNIAIG